MNSSMNLWSFLTSSSTLVEGSNPLRSITFVLDVCESPASNWLKNWSDSLVYVGYSCLTEFERIYQMSTEVELVGSKIFVLWSLWQALSGIEQMHQHFLYLCLRMHYPARRESTHTYTQSAQTTRCRLNIHCINRKHATQYSEAQSSLN